MLNKVNGFLKIADQICDYVPVVSTASNLTDLFQKHVFMNFFIEKTTIEKNTYLSHLKQKSTSRCVALLFPVIGNVGCLIYDRFFNKATKEETPPNSTPSSTPDISESSSEEKPTPVVSEMNSPTTKDPEDQSFLDEPSLFDDSWELSPNPWSSSNEEILRKLTRHVCSALDDAGKKQRSDETFMRSAIQKAGSEALRYADPILTSNRAFMLDAIKEEGGAFIYASETLKKDPTFMLDAIEKNHLAFVCFPQEVKESAEFREEAFQRNPDVARHFIWTTNNEKEKKPDII